MSVLVRDPEGRVRLYTKGADSVIYQRLKEGHDQRVKDETSRDLEIFANAGLRTLCVAWRYVGEDEYQAFSKEFVASRRNSWRLLTPRRSETRSRCCQRENRTFVGNSWS